MKLVLSLLFKLGSLGTRLACSRSLVRPSKSAPIGFIFGGSNCIVIDYKSKGKGGMKRLVESETSLQGPLYSLALRRQFGLNTVAMAYWAVRENELHGWGEIPGYQGENPLQPMPPDWENAAWTRIAGRLAAFFAGDIAPTPTDEDSCRFCDARDCCRVEEGRGLVMIETARA